jgi:hypothetical protein
MISTEDVCTRAEVISVAGAMLSGKIHLIEGVRQICSLRFELEEPDDKVFMPMVAVESETDYFPLGSLRRQYAVGALQRLDNELDEYLAVERTDILNACKAIIHRFTQFG